MTNPVTISLTCTVCDKDTEFKAEAPLGWEADYVYSSDCFCPDHAIVKDFMKTQCPGCVGSFGDCALFDAMRPRNTLTENDYESIRHGTCPKRVNGTFTLDNRPGSHGQRREVNISDPATTASGVAFAGAIKTYFPRG